VKQLRHSAGVPTVEDFAAFDGTPIIIDTNTGVLYELINGVVTQGVFGGSIILPKESGSGIQIGPYPATYGWRDLLGPIDVKTVGATEPIWALYRGSIYAYTFDTATAECFLTFHIPHDWVPGVVGAGRSAYIHMHWSTNVVATGNIEWNFDISYADGHGVAGGAADPFIAPITVKVVQQASTTQYGHMIAEVEFANDGGTGGKLDYNTIVVDGLLLVRAYRIKGNAADTLNQVPFGHTCDIHYQSTNLGTKQKEPDFYT